MRENTLPREGRSRNLFHPFGRKKTPEHAYDPAKEKAIIRASICTGEQVAGFKNKETGVFHEVMLIRNQKDREKFMRAYGLEHIDTEY